MRDKPITMDNIIRHAFISHNIDLLFTDENKCWNWPGNQFNEDGYGLLRIYYTHSVRRIYAHRVSFMIFNQIDFLDIGDCILHECDNPSCVNPKHLFLGTRADNLEDMTRKGRRVKGITHGNSFLTIEQVQQLREDRKAGMFYKDLGEKYGCNMVTAWNIVNGKTWKSS